MLKINYLLYPNQNYVKTDISKTVLSLASYVSFVSFTDYLPG